MGVEGRGPTRRRQRMTTTTTSGSRQPRRARGRGGTSRGVEGVQQSDSRATAVDMRKSRRLLWRRCRCWLLLQGAAAGGCCGAPVCAEQRAASVFDRSVRMFRSAAALSSGATPSSAPGGSPMEPEPGSFAALARSYNHRSPVSAERLQTRGDRRIGLLSLGWWGVLEPVRQVHTVMRITHTHTAHSPPAGRTPRTDQRDHGVTDEASAEASAASSTQLAGRRSVSLA